MRPPRIAAQRLLVALILASTAAFVVGVLLERDQTAGEAGETPAQRAAEAGTAGPASETTAGSEPQANGESGERHNESGASTRTAGPPAGKPAEHTEAPGHAESSETLLGVNPESTGLLAVAVVASLLLAAAVWWRGGSPLVLAVVALAMAVFCALDVREVVHEVDESRTGLAVLAAVVAALHLAAALLAGRAAVTARGVPPPVTLSAPAL
jgi:hypothetical protein